MLAFSYEGFEGDNCQDILQSQDVREVHIGESSSGEKQQGAAERQRKGRWVVPLVERLPSA